MSNLMSVSATLRERVLKSLELKGFEYAKRGADQGHQESSVLILRAIHAEDPDLQCSDTETFKYWKHLADLEASGEAIMYKQAQAEVSRRYFEGIGVEISPNKGFAYAKVAAAQGKDSCPDFILNKLLARENRFESTASELFNYWQLAADQGDNEAQFEIGLRYYKGSGEEQSDSEAFKCWQLALDQEDTETSLEVDNRDIESFKYLKRAEDQGFISAQIEVGERYFRGIGVPQSHSETRKYIKLLLEKEEGALYVWIIRGLKSGDPDFQFTASDVFEYWKLAADYGDSSAQQKVTDFYATGTGVEQSDVESFNYWKMAADPNNWRSAEAQMKVAELYDKGKGVEQSDSEALRYWQMAADGGNPEAKRKVALP